MNKKDFKIGQKVYLKIIEGSNAARGIDKTNPNAWIKEKFVTKIGTKYITVTNNIEGTWGEEKFDITDDFNHYYTTDGQDYELFLSIEDLQEDIESEEIYDYIKQKFSDWKNNRMYTLDQLQE